ncbi:MAG: RNA polymerase factor sigma-54 [Bacteroidetes bacterium]|nr:RNA polymerase factor sigma-54 [Bacteroidota bacterium]
MAAMRQSLQQKLQQKLSPQQIQLMKLLQVPVAALEQRIKEEIEENPALEEGAETSDQELEAENAQEDSQENSDQDLDLGDYLDDDDYPYYKTQISNQGADDEHRDIPYSAGPSFQEQLTVQIGWHALSDAEQVLARHIIGNIDEDGYLMRDVEAMVDDLAFSQGIETSSEELERILGIVQQFDPAGVGARDLAECLLLQLKRKSKSSSVLHAIAIMESYFEEFSKKHFEKIQKRLGLTEADMKEAIQEITHLNPKPGSSATAAQRNVPVIVPDFSLVVDEDKLELSLNGKNAPELRVSRHYHNMMEGIARQKRQPNEQEKQTLQFVKQKLDSARWFIDAIKQRQHTLMLVMHTILELQKEYFLSGDETKLKPMILKDVADRVNLDISTVSRVANSKYIETPYGTLLLKSFFSESLSTDSGEEVSTREVKKILSDCIEGEDKRKPITDDRLAEILKEQGYNIARRTVAKYREQLGIPVARLRKVF